MEKTGVRCPNCGQANPDGWLVCGVCHAPLRPGDPMAAEFANQDSPEVEQPAHSEESERSAPRLHRKTSRLALASLAFGVVGVLAPAGLLAIVLGHAAQIQIRRNRSHYRGKDVAKLGLLLGYLGVAIFAVLFLGMRNVDFFSLPKQTASSVAAPNPALEKTDPYYRAINGRPQMSAAERENKGVILIKALQKAESDYKSAHPAVGYTCVLEDLFEVGLDQGTLQVSIDTGYTLSITECSANPKGTRETYRAFATPPSGTGNMLCSDQEGVIRSSNSTSNDACFTSGKPLAIQ
jgi:Domain of unknown function (DUF4190)